jgi:hypothetical protein
MRFVLQEDEPDFARAWALEPARERGQRIPRHCLDPRLLWYRRVAMLGTQIERLFAVAGRDRSHVIVFDDLARDPLGVYHRVLEFLGVDDDGQTQFEPRFKSRMYRYRWLQRILFAPATRSGMVHTMQRHRRKYNPDGSKQKSLIARVARWNKVPASPAPLTPQMVATVREALGPDVAKLSSLLDRDLTFWLAG